MEEGVHLSSTNQPLYEALKRNISKNPMSFHVPGHKYGKVYGKESMVHFQSILDIDATEVNGLDDLHAPEKAIREAQELACHFFNCDHTFFLVNGTTVGNLAMILAVCRPGNQIIVQRNCHKSVLNGLELAGASPVFLSPRYEDETGRYSRVCVEDVEQVLKQYPESKAVFLTYPDYFGRVYNLEEVARVVHKYNIPLLVDEAHGVHFQLEGPFPKPALAAGADVVTQSAHKMAPAMTMASYLHIQGERVDTNRIRHYLQMLQSSSPSYPLMASLDIARSYLSSWGTEDLNLLLPYINRVREIFSSYRHRWEVKSTRGHDPLKLTLDVKKGTGFEVANIMDESGVIPEMATSSQVLLVLGLAPSVNLEQLEFRLRTVDYQLKKVPDRATIREDQIPFPTIQQLELSYSDMQGRNVEKVKWVEAEGRVAAEALIPYPPGIPLVMKGERIGEKQIHNVQNLIKQGARFQNIDMKQGILVFKGE